MQEQAQSQYAAAANIPLIQSPLLRAPPPVQLPPDIHPLPDSVTEYFVYPFTLEPHVLTLETSRRTTLAAHATRREAYLRSREEEKERRRREALRKIAPGFDPQAPLTPLPLKSSPASPGSHPGLTSPGASQGATGPHRSVMDDLVDQLAAMETAGGSSSSRS
ncbi:hypothetical protein AX16_007410 [Volvariella volvacea WC 439]|nr:hypothetical protein AX16_007410 [Volvariella volvacea WC 439]